MLVHQATRIKFNSVNYCNYSVDCETKNKFSATKIFSDSHYSYVFAGFIATLFVCWIFTMKTGYYTRFNLNSGLYSLKELLITLIYFQFNYIN